MTDRKRGKAASGTDIQWFEADVVSAQQYYPFGMLMPGRQYPTNNSVDYRYGFNGKEGDDEVKGDDNQQDYGMRIYDPRVGRFLSVDPLAKEFPWNSTYAFAENDVIRAIDLDGLEKLIIHAARISTVNNTKIKKEKADFIAYRLSFTIDYPNGTVEKLNAGKEIIMFENKSLQEGRLKSNALVEGNIYDLNWQAFGSFQERRAIHIKKFGKGHSDRTFIHPLGTTAKATSGGGTYTKGCKGLACEEDIEISKDGRNLFAGEPYEYNRGPGRAEVTYPAPERINEERNINAFNNSYDTIDMIRKLWRDNFNKLQKENNFQLKVEAESPQLLPTQNDSTKTNKPGN